MKVLATSLTNFASPTVAPPPGEAPHVVNFSESVIQPDNSFTNTSAKITYGTGTVEPHLTLACVDPSTNPDDAAAILAADGPKATTSGVTENSVHELVLPADQIVPFAGMLRMLAVVAH